MPTVRHTGTLLFRQHILKMFHLRRGPNRLVAKHTNEAGMAILKQWDGADVTYVIPLRDPRLVAESWGRRGELTTWDGYDFEGQWLNLFHFDQFSPWYIPIDKPGLRQAALELLQAHLGIPLGTSWPKVNSHPEDLGGPIPHYLWLYEQPVVSRYYDATPGVTPQPLVG